MPVLAFISTGTSSGRYTATLPAPTWARTRVGSLPKWTSVRSITRSPPASSYMSLISATESGWKLRGPAPPRNGTSSTLAATTTGISSTPNRTSRMERWCSTAPTTSPTPITVRNRAKIRPMVSSAMPTLLRKAATPTARKATARVTQPRLDRLRPTVQPSGGGSPQARAVVAATPGGAPPPVRTPEDGGPPQSWAVTEAPAGGGGPHPAVAGPPPQPAGGGPAGTAPASPGPPVADRSPPGSYGAPAPIEGSLRSSITPRAISTRPQMTPGRARPSSPESTEMAISTSTRPIQVRAFGRRSAAWPIDSLAPAGGTAIQRAAYSSSPTPPVNVSTTKAMRNTIGSTLK